MKIRVADNDRFVRDTRNFAILGTDKSLLDDHERKLAKIRREQAQQDEINNIKSDIAEIKAMLAQLLKE